MPQGPQATPPIVRSTTGASASTSTTATDKTLPQEVTEAFKGFLSSVFGQNPATPVPGSAGATTQGTPGVVGGLPPNMVTPPASLSMPPPVAPQQQPRTQPVRGVAPAGTTYGTGASAVEAGTAAFGDALVSAIEGSKAKKDADNIARAQNTMNIFLHAVQQGDMATANLYASDPKITGMWEKYLKQEYKRVPGVPSPKQKPAESLNGMDISAVGNVPYIPDPSINEPGGIAVPQDMTPEGQIRAHQLAAIQESFKTMSPQQVAATTPSSVINMEAASLSPEEFKKSTQMKYGLALTKEQDATIDAQTKIAQANYMADLMKYTVGQYSMTQRSAMTSGATVEAAKIRAASALKVMQEHMKGLKSIQDKRGMALSTAMYEQQMKGYQAMAAQLNKDLLGIDPQTGLIWTADNPEYIRKKAELDNYMKLADAAKTEWEGLKVIGDNFPELMNTEPEAPATPAEQEP